MFDFCYIMCVITIHFHTVLDSHSVPTLLTDVFLKLRDTAWNAIVYTVLGSHSFRQLHWKKLYNAPVHDINFNILHRYRHGYLFFLINEHCMECNYLYSLDVHTKKHWYVFYIRYMTKIVISYVIKFRHIFYLFSIVHTHG